MGDTNESIPIPLSREAKAKAAIEKSRKIAKEVSLRIRNDPPIPIILSQEIIDNDGGIVCMNCRQKDDFDINMLVCPCYNLNRAPEIPPSFPKKANQIPCLIYLFIHRVRTSANDLLKLFSVYGPITKVEIPTAKRTGLPANYGLVSFENVDDAERALDALKEQGHFVEWFDFADSWINYKCNRITSSSSASSSQG
ncbi:hypothetical protein FRX31_006081 [Thalictrum thalictroides]|uniref:RRM domain-containing protein n=1 Tax=Thalictrum thalictroides TaxID=46969 RepID=A0A7J6X7J3_THATH|nr:hypothetical protein FRX31_006081 [Thalictrum thalictroides]